MSFPHYYKLCVVLQDEDSGVVLDGSTASSPVDILGTKQVSYMDYVPLWVAACSRGIVKVRTHLTVCTCLALSRRYLPCVLHATVGWTCSLCMYCAYVCVVVSN